MNQIADLFIVNNEVNKNLGEVRERCEQFGRDCGFEFFESSMPQNTRQSQQTLTSGHKKTMVPEMLAPDETAQLIANVIQKIGFSPRGPQNHMDFSVEQQTQNP